MERRRVAVLCGGVSAEREVSLASGDAVARGLEDAGYPVVCIDVTLDLDRQLREAAPEVAFVALHGRFGEDGAVQGLLELMRIPYTGSSLLASALAMDKLLSRTVLAAAGLPLAPGGEIFAREPAALPDTVSLPAVVKPACEGSSVGVTIVRDAGDLEDAVRRAAGTDRKSVV